MYVAGIITDIGHALLDFIYPRVCPACSKRLENDSPLCSGCRNDLNEKSDNFRHESCSVDYADRVVVLLPYDTVTRKMVHDLKYHGNPDIGVLLGKMIGEKLKRYKQDSTSLLVPVPLHDKKLKSRGYNQSERIARGIADTTGLTVAETLLTRSKDTGTQTALSAEERRENVSGVFICTGTDKLGGQDIIIIDDVLTTGSTLGECAKTLKDAGAGNITVCVAATPGVHDD